MRAGRGWIALVVLLGATVLAAPAPPAVAPPRPADGGPRQRLLDDGEALLAAGDAAAAEQAFDRAGLLQHAADAEVALVRTYMQAGGYRRALAFAAHAAGAHCDEAGAAALYVWLLHLGGQATVALRLLEQARADAPDDADLRRVQALTAGAPSAAGNTGVSGGGRSPLRLAPYAAPAADVSAAARTVGSSVLVSGGTRAVAPAALLGGATRVWVRNGLGQTAAARAERIDADAGVAVLRLATPLAPCLGLVARPAEPFAGSPAAMVEYDASADTADLAWPRLRQGFFGRPAGAAAERPLGIDAPPGPLGGPVFDAAGRLAGMAWTSADGGQRLLGNDALAALLSESPAAKPPRDQRPGPVGVDGIYECALRVALQLIVEH